MVEPKQRYQQNKGLTSLLFNIAEKRRIYDTRGQLNNDGHDGFGFNNPFAGFEVSSLFN